MQYIFAGIPEAVRYASFEKYTFTFSGILLWPSQNLIAYTAFYNRYFFVLQPVRMHQWTFARLYIVFYNDPVAVRLLLYPEES